jgi:protein dithiol:quinone oxidoreductase
MNDAASAAAGQNPLRRLLFSRRSGNLIGFLVCAVLLAFAYYLQFARGLEPCPLCILQRVILAATALAFLAAAIHHPARAGAWIYGALAFALAAIGTAVAGRHVWLQHTPEAERPSCGPGLDYLLSRFGPVGGLQRILRGSGECGVVDWTFLGLSIPEWTLACFIGLGIYALALAARD